MPALPDALPVKNTTTEAIPAFGLMRVTGVTAAGVLEVAKPDTDGQVVLTNGPTAIPPSTFVAASGALVASGQGTFAPRIPIAYDPADGTPGVGETWGAGAGSWLARKDNAGFLVFGGAGAGIVNAVRWSDGGGESGTLYRAFCDSGTLVWQQSTDGGATWVTTADLGVACVPDSGSGGGSGSGSGSNPPNPCTACIPSSDSEPGDGDGTPFTYTVCYEGVLYQVEGLERIVFDPVSRVPKIDKYGYEVYRTGCCECGGSGSGSGSGSGGDLCPGAPLTLSAGCSDAPCPGAPLTLEVSCEVV